MKVDITLIRHGKTAGNRCGQYIGRTDEVLHEEGIRELQASSFPFAANVVVSPMKRCVETADILFPGAVLKQEPDFRECDFGSYEGKTYKELLDDPVYQRFLETGVLYEFPAGERVDEFRRRCQKAFHKHVQECFDSGQEELVLVVHGGTIMSIMEAYAGTAGSYYDWQVANGCGWLVRAEDAAWQSGHPRVEIRGKTGRKEQ